jgi:hypothetical protein
VVVAPHDGPLDLFLAAAAYPRRLEVLGIVRFLKVPLLAAALRARGFHGLERSRARMDVGNAETLARAARALETGASVLLFPQEAGGRLGGGAARLAAESRRPIVPLGVLRAWYRGARHRVWVVVGRPLPAPEAGARVRREATAGIARALARGAGVGAAPERREALELLLQDPSLPGSATAALRVWRRVARTPLDGLGPLLRAGRALRRAAAAARCSVGDLLRPAGAGEAALLALLAPAAAVGVVLGAPARFFLRRRLRRVEPAELRRAAFAHGAFRAALPYGAGLAAIGWALSGAAGLLAPIVALLGLLARGALLPLRSRVRASFRARGARARLRRPLEVFRAWASSAARASGTSSPARSRARARRASRFPS